MRASDSPYQSFRVDMNGKFVAFLKNSTVLS
jgi:hypothetical protein